VTPARVLLVDDHRVVIQGLEVLLGSYPDIDVVGVATSGSGALEAYDRLRPEVVLMDVSMPGMTGIQATQELRRRDPDARVIILSAFAAQSLVDQVVAAGAYGYLLKSVSGQELVSAIVAAAGGRATFSGEALSKHSSRGGPPALGQDLPTRELEVLHAHVRGQSHKEIARALTLSSGTIRVHVSSILSKLGVENRTAAAFVAQQEGLVETGQPFVADE
jgi:DNA-binding NarL/FixJ family response regulator